MTEPSPLAKLAQMARRAVLEDPRVIARVYRATMEDPDARLVLATMEYGGRVRPDHAARFRGGAQAVLIQVPEGRFWLTSDTWGDRTLLPPAPVVPALGLLRLGQALVAEM